MAILYKANGKTLEVSPKNNKYFTIEELYEMIGSPVDMRYLANDQIVIFHDNGKVLHLAFNVAATEIYQTHGDPNDFLAGDVLLCEQNELEQDEE
jgi:hypothetical protein